ncbi:MAG: hypothetical protein RLZZ308_536 [Candidatus Parcubacteria bacterium]|jgi:peptide/nickel transport system substrate-binding protein
MKTSQYTFEAKAFIQHLNFVYKSLSSEKVLALWLFIFFSLVFFFSSAIAFNAKFLTEVPSYGGSVSEGIIGTPRFINPVLATTDQDKDVTTLVFAGLTKKMFDGSVSLDIAESINESDDGLHYIVTLKKNARFHDGENVTADDVLFTIDKIQNPTVKSPHKIEWEGVTAEKTGDSEVTFTLKKPFPLFMETLSIGILPKHVWKNLSDDQMSLSDFNVNAIGSGPYKIEHIVTESGIPKVFILKAHDRYTLGRPYIETITLSSYQNEKYLLKAFEDGDIQRIHGISPEKINTLDIATSSIHTSLLPRTFAIFFNPNKSESLADRNIRTALQLAIDKEKIIREIFYGYGKPLSSPYPFDTDQESSEYNPEKAKELLQKNKESTASSTLEISLTTANTEEMKKVAEMIQADWEKVGITTTIKIYDVSDLNQDIIKERDFQLLLFGAITQTPSDLYAFWHSSQRTFPGLNISNYVSKTLDEHLETLRSSKEEESRRLAYEEVRKEFKDEVPGIFLFAPSLIYITQDKNTTILPTYSYDNSSRFVFSEKWYRYTNKIWPSVYYKPSIELLQNIIH